MPSASKSCLSEHVDRFYPGSIQDGPGITDEWGQRSGTSWLSGTVRVPDSWRAPVVIPNVQGEAETSFRSDAITVFGGRSSAMAFLTPFFSEESQHECGLTVAADVNRDGSSSSRLEELPINAAACIHGVRIHLSSESTEDGGSSFHESPSRRRQKRSKFGLACTARTCSSSSTWHHRQSLSAMRKKRPLPHSNRGGASADGA